MRLQRVRPRPIPPLLTFFENFIWKRLNRFLRWPASIPIPVSLTTITRSESLPSLSIIRTLTRTVPLFVYFTALPIKLKRTYLIRCLSCLIKVGREACRSSRKSIPFSRALHLSDSQTLVIALLTSKLVSWISNSPVKMIPMSVKSYAILLRALQECMRSKQYFSIPGPTTF